MDSRPHVWFCACKSAALAHELLVSVGPSPHLWFLHAKQRLLYEHTSLYGFQTSTVASCIQNSVISTRITGFYGSQPSSVVFCLQNSYLRRKIASLYGSQTSHVIFCLQNSVPSIWITSLYGSQPSCVVFGCKKRDLRQNDKSIWVPALICVFLICKTATLGPDLQVCMDPRPQLWFWAHITACLAQE